MESSNLFERSYRDNFVMGGNYEGTPHVMGPYAPQYRSMKPGRTPSRPNLKLNFSHTRPDGHPPRYESAESRSSLTSSGSNPGMTDASDSEASVDDDYNYNTSASELWDSFWPEAVDKQHSLHKSPSSTALFSARIRDYFGHRRSTTELEEAEDDTITITQLEKDLQDAKPSHWPWSPRTSPTRPRHTRSPATYSVYPKVSAASARLAPFSAQTVPAPEPAPPIRRRPLKASRSIANIQTSNASASLYHATSPSTPTAAITHTRSAPVSPVGPPPPPPKLLRPSASAYNIRERSQLGKSQHNATAPLVPIAPSQPRCVLDGARPFRPQLERFVSVFELDDAEAEPENNGFAKRLARGLHHKRTPSDKRSSGEKKAAAAASAGIDGTENTLGMKLGGPLGRMLGLKSR
jgi:hypothetical protein